MKIGVKHVFNLKNERNYFGYEPFEAAALTFNYLSYRSAFIYDVLDKKHLLSRSGCTAFCVGNFDFRSTDAQGLYFGGSSSGSVRDVLDEKVDVAVSTDTGNSTIWPAVRHNLCAFKPSYGAISRQGLVPLCSKLDTVAIIAKDPQKIKSTYLQLIKLDPRDLTQQKDLKHEKQLSFLEEVFCYPSRAKLKIAQDLFDPTAVAKLKKKYPLATVQKLDFPPHMNEILMGAYLYTMAPEFFSNMAKFNGVFHKDNCATDMLTAYDLKKIKENRSLFDQEIKKRIFLGAHLLNPDIQPYDVKKVDLLVSYLNEKIGLDAWVLPVTYNNESVYQNTYDKGKGPVWPIIGNLTKRAAAALVQTKEDNIKYFILFPRFT